MKKSALTLLVLGLAVCVALFYWLRLEEPARGQRGSTPAEAATPLQPAAAPAGLAEPPPAGADAPQAPPPPVAVRAAAAGAEDQRSALGSAAGRTVRGSVASPAGAPADDSLRVLALTEALSPRQVYGVGGVLDDLAEGKSAKVLGTAPVDAAGHFNLPLSADSTVWLALDGRYLYSSQMIAVPAGTGTLTLAAELGGCLAGRVQLPAGSEPAATVLEKLEVQLGPDSADFSMNASEPPLRRRARPDAEGRFEVRAVRAGLAHELELDSDHCADTTVSGLELAPGERRELEIELLSGASVRGSVLDEGGQPVAEAEVIAAESGFWGFPGEELAEAKTDAGGAFALEHIQPGKFLVIARHEGHLESEAQTLELADGAARDGLRLRLGAGASIAGRVLLPDGTPAAGAEIDVSFDLSAMVGMGAMNAVRGAEGGGQCGGEGRFVVSGLGKGPFAVKAELERALGTEKEAWRAKVTGVAPGTQDLVLTLAAPCVLAGRVVDSAGAPVTEFRLRAHSAGAIFFDPGVTREEPIRNEQGEFRLRGLDAGKWQVTASAEGFGPPAPVEVTLPQAEGEPLVVTLAPAASIAGTVVDPLGAPVAGARVRLHADPTQRLQRLSGTSKQPEAQSGEDGTFVLGGLGIGTSSIEASREGFAASEPVEVALKAGERSTGAVLHLRKGAVVTGEVYGPDGRPAAGVRVIAQSPGGLDMTMKQADGEGRFRLEHLQPGSWTVTALLDTTSVDPEGEADDTTAAFLGNMRFAMVQLEEGEEEHVVLGAPPKDPVVVRGTVRHGKEPVTNGVVSFFAEGAKGLESLKMASLGADGRYEARLDAPGKYVLSVQVTGGSGAFQQHTIEFRETVPEVEEHTLDLSLPLGGVQGRVRGPDREPLANARVTLVTEGGIELGSMMGGQYSEAMTDEGGNYTFAYLRPGRYAVAAGGALFGGAFGSESNAGRVVRAGLRVDEGRTLEGVDFELESPGSIAGKVVDATGLAVKDVSVFVRDANGLLLDRFSMTTSAGDGSFEYKGLGPGEYVVSARGKNLASAESAPVRVEEGATARVELVLHPGTKLVIEVVDGEGNAVQASISVTDPSGREVQGMVGMADMSSLFADGLDTQKQVVGPLPPGSYTVTAVASDGKKTTKPVTLDGQPERRLKLRIR